MVKLVYHAWIKDNLISKIDVSSTFDEIPLRSYYPKNANVASAIFQNYIFNFYHGNFDDESITQINEYTLYFHKIYTAFEPIYKLLKDYNSISMHNAISLPQLVGLTLLDQIKADINKVDTTLCLQQSACILFSKLFQIDDPVLWDMKKTESINIEILQAIGLNPAVLLLIDNDKQYGHLKDYYPEYKEKINIAYSLYPDDKLLRYNSMCHSFLDKNEIEPIQLDGLGSLIIY